MYANYYGLTHHPFETTPDPEVVFMSETHQEALSMLRYGVIERKSFLLLTGDVGAGKTTLLNLLINSLGDRMRYCLISNPSLSVNDFYYTLASNLSLKWPGGSKARFLAGFALFLKDCRRKKERVLLFIDEAHVLSVKLLEEVRLLSNQSMEASGVLTIFLVGQPELNQRLGHERLLPLRQRISIRFHLNTFNQDETASYIDFRLRRAGASRTDLFSPQALAMIHRFSRGVPRLINTICDQALLTGFAENRPVIQAETIRDCVNELHIPGETTRLPLPVSRPVLHRMLNQLATPIWAAAVAVLMLAVGGAWLWQENFWPKVETILPGFMEIVQYTRNLVRL